MGSYVDLNESSWDLVAGFNEGMAISVALVEGQIWCCLVCGFQGIWLPQWNEASPPNPWSLGVDSCCGGGSKVATWYWSAIGKIKKTESKVTLWEREGDKIRCQVLRQTEWEHQAVAQAGHLFQWLCEAGQTGLGFDDLVAGSNSLSFWPLHE